MPELEMISPGMLDQYRNRKDTLIIDLRPEDEFGKYHIPGARQIEYEDVQTLFSLPRDKTIVLCCERGASSMARAKEMARDGYRVKSLIGGMHAYREYKNHGSNRISR